MLSRVISTMADLSYGPLFAPLRTVAAGLAYPLAQRLERRTVGVRIAELRRSYRGGIEERRITSRRQLADMLLFAAAEVPYYRDLFSQLRLDPEKLATDPRRLEQLPLLTKQIISEQGPRMLSRTLSGTRHYAMPTGGSTGIKTTIYYDQDAADYSAAVTAFARGRAGASHGRSTLHFAARLPDTPKERWPSRELMKGIAMNRSNIFFAEVDARALNDIWNAILRRRPHLVHGHPSTLFALADFVESQGFRAQGDPPAFAIFESSGEVLDKRQRGAIETAFGCRVVDRYGLAEFGVIAYEFEAGRLEVLDTECWIESPLQGPGAIEPVIVTGLRNRLMPLIRYDTGDLAELEGEEKTERLKAVVGRIHDVVAINGVPHLTHYVQDVLDHRVRGIKDFQIDSRPTPPILRIALEDPGTSDATRRAIETYWPGAFSVEFVELTDMIRVGDRAKFRHVVTA